MSQYRSRPSNASGIYYDGFVRAAARIIDERPWLQTIDGDAQRSIFVGVCMAIHRYYRSGLPFLTLRSRLLHAYAQSGLVQVFSSRTSQNKRIRTARRPRDRRDAHARARCAPVVAQHAPARVEAVSQCFYNVSCVRVAWNSLGECGEQASRSTSSVASMLFWFAPHAAC